MAQRVGGDEIEAAVADVGGRGHRVEDPLHGRTHPFLGRTPARRTRRRVGGAHQVEEVGSFRLVELQRSRDALEHVLGGAGWFPRSKRV